MEKNYLLTIHKAFSYGDCTFRPGTIRCGTDRVLMPCLVHDHCDRDLAHFVPESLKPPTWCVHDLFSVDGEIVYNPSELYSFEPIFQTETVNWFSVEDATPPEEAWYLAHLVWPEGEPGSVHMMKWMNNAGIWGWYAPLHNSPHRGITHWANRPVGPNTSCFTCNDTGYVPDVGPSGEPAGDNCPDCGART